MTSPTVAAPTIVLHRRFICVEVSFNEKGHNKFWYITVYSDGKVKTEWGRVDLTCSEKIFDQGSSEKGIEFAEKKIREKTTKKGDTPYKEINVVNTGSTSPTKMSGSQIESQAVEQISKGDKKIEDLVKYLVKTNIHNITNNTNLRYDDTTGLFSTPLGIVGQSNLDEARKIIIDISKFVETNDHDNPQAIPLLNNYLSLIPQGFGMNRPTLKLLVSDQSAVQKQYGILDSLQASLDMLAKSANDPKVVSDKPKVWDVSISSISDKKEIERINKKFQASSKSNHACSHLKIVNVYDVNVTKMTKGYDDAGSKLGNVMELWHGTRVGNILSIFSKGFIIPPSNASYCTGRMFGNGIYFSDQSTKSLNYSFGYWGGGTRDNNCFMFLANVAMGKTFTPSGPSQSLPKVGYDSTFAMGGKSGVMNNEMIVYKTDHCRITRLVEFKG